LRKTVRPDETNVDRSSRDTVAKGKDRRNERGLMIYAGEKTSRRGKKRVVEMLEEKTAGAFIGGRKRGSALWEACHDREVSWRAEHGR